MGSGERRAGPIAVCLIMYAKHLDFFSLVIRIYKKVLLKSNVTFIVDGVKEYWSLRCIDFLVNRGLVTYST